MGEVYYLIRLRTVWVVSRRQVYPQVIPIIAQYSCVGDILDSASLRRICYGQLICRTAYKRRIILFFSVYWHIYRVEYIIIVSYAKRSAKNGISRINGGPGVRSGRIPNTVIRPTLRWIIDTVPVTQAACVHRNRSRPISICIFGHIS